MEAQRSSATGASISNDKGAVVFPCPKCGEEKIVRSSGERKNVVKYSCTKCGFTGPN